MNETMLNNNLEDFILKYKAADAAKLTRQQLSDILGMKVVSIDRKRLKIKESLGIELPVLLSDPNSKLESKSKQRYEDCLKNLLNKVLTSHNINTREFKSSLDDAKNKIFVITAAQNATNINVPFFKALQNYIKDKNAELYVIPYRYKNPNSLWTAAQKTSEWWHADLNDYLLVDELQITEHVKVMGHIKIQPTATNPLSGFDTVVGMESAIFGHPKVALKVIPSKRGKMPKIISTTGSITVPNYTDTKTGHKGLFHHTIGAIVLEIDADGHFHQRHITANPETGGFYDLDTYYDAKTIRRNVRAAALVAGDIHAEVADENVVQSIFTGVNSIANVVNPEYFIIHDLLDFEVRSHHTIRDKIGRFTKHVYGDDNVEEALQKAASFLTTINKEGTQTVIVKSNHDEHFTRWLNEADPSYDPENAKFYHYMKYHQYKHAYDKKHFDAFKFWCRNPDVQDGVEEEVYDNLIFLSKDEIFEVNGVEVGYHGDIGTNGSRGSLNNLSRIGEKMIIGHTHTPGIMNGSYQVGTTTPLHLDYTHGPSSWMNTAAIIYEDGSATLVNIIEGKWTSN